MKEKESIWGQYTAEEKQELEVLCKGYLEFLSKCKTERESVAEAVRQAEAVGYRSLADVLAAGGSLQAGDKVYAVNMKKAVVLFHMGTEPMEKGMEA